MGLAYLPAFDAVPRLIGLVDLQGAKIFAHLCFWRQASASFEVKSLTIVSFRGAYLLVVFLPFLLLGPLLIVLSRCQRRPQIAAVTKSPEVSCFGWQCYAVDTVYTLPSHASSQDNKMSSYSWTRATFTFCLIQEALSFAP